MTYVSSNNKEKFTNKHLLTSDQNKKPVVPLPIVENIPPVLKELPHWLLWRFEWKGKKWDKPPCSPFTLGSASTTDPKTWSGFNFAWQQLLANQTAVDGLGFVFDGKSGLCGIDLDDCRCPDTGEIKPDVMDIIKRFGTYSEVSPTGTGIKMIGYAEVGTGFAQDGIEGYDRGRYFTVTGNRIGDADGLANVQAFIDEKRPKTDNSEKPPRGQADADAQGEQSAWLERWLASHNIDVNRRATKPDGIRYWYLSACPWCENPDAAVMVRPNGVIGFNCFHSTVAECSSKVWRDFRKHFEPDYGEPEPAMIDCGRQISDIVDNAAEALRRANNPPRLFMRGGRITELKIDDRTPLFEPLNDGAIIRELSRAAAWKRWNKTEKKYKSCALPEQVVRVFKGGFNFGLPIVDSIFENPCFTAKGTLLDQAGYHAGDRIWLHSDLALAPIPKQPTAEQIAVARSLFFDELLIDFPFATEADKANALALMLLPFVRLMIDGPTPLHLIDAPTEGTGKSLLTKLFCSLSCGREVDAKGACESDAEWSKSLLAWLMKGSPVMLIDNVGKSIKSESLARALTASRFGGRLLGGNENASLPVQCVWLATGNNTTSSKEIADRIVRVRLDAKCEHPRQRTGFKHPDILGWCRANRASLVSAALTLVQAWIASGKPKGQAVKGSFESWVSVIGGILDVAGVVGFLANDAEQADSVNTSHAEWKRVVERWWNKFAEQPVDSRTLFDAVSKWGLLTGYFENSQDPVKKFALMLNKQRDKTYGELQIKDQGYDRHTHAKMYKLTPLAMRGREQPKPEPPKPEQPAKQYPTRFDGIGASWRWNPNFRDFSHCQGATWSGDMPPDEPKWTLDFETHGGCLKWFEPFRKPYEV